VPTVSRPPLHFDLGLSEADVQAMKEARRRPVQVDLESAFRFIAAASAQVSEAVRSRPLLTGPPFELPGHREDDTPR
jgi:hypothetical protein